MKRDVSKKTVKHLSELTTGFRASDVHPPSVKFFIEKIKLKYLAMISRAELNMEASNSDGRKEKYSQQKENYKTKLKQFKKTISNIPKGFSLSAVMYSRISGEQNRKVEKEFSTYVRPRFMIYLAENHSDDLKKIGICKCGIERMRNGLEPTDKNWNFYNLTVDHIIERSGSGELGRKKEYDKKTGQYMHPTYKVNHFANLILMPHSIHNDVKNFINELQDLPSMNEGDSVWSLSLVPTGRTVGESCVYVPKNDNDKDKFVAKNKRNVKTQIGQIVYLSKQLDVEAKLFLEFYGKGVRGEKDIKYRKKRTGSLADSFNGKEQANYIYNRRIKPLVGELADILDIIDRDIEQMKADGKDIRKISEQLQKTLSSLPVCVAEARVQDVSRFKGEFVSKKFTDKKFYMIDKYCKNTSSNSKNSNKNSYKR